jgi:hypothetical protein
VKRCERLSASNIGTTLNKNIGAAMRPALIGEAGRFHSANIKIFTDFSYSPRFAYVQSTNRSANNIGAA